MAATVQTVGTYTSSSSATSIDVFMPASIAVGDLLVAHVAGQTNSTSYNTPAGWTLTRDASGANSVMAVFHKVAVLADVSASTTTFTTTGSNARISGRILRINGQRSDFSTVMDDANGAAGGSNTTPTSSGFTPSYTDDLIMIFVCAQNSRTNSTYAIATTPPTFTEHYDDQESNLSISAASGLRNVDTATGNATSLLSSAAFWSIVVIAISSFENATVTPTVLPVSSSFINPALLLESNLSPTVLGITSAIQPETVSVQTNPVWSNLPKDNSVWTNTPK